MLLAMPVSRLAIPGKGKTIENCLFSGYRETEEWGRLVTHGCLQFFIAKDFGRLAAEIRIGGTRTPTSISEEIML